MFEMSVRCLHTNIARQFLGGQTSGERTHKVDMFMIFKPLLLERDNIEPKIQQEHNRVTRSVVMEGPREDQWVVDQVGKQNKTRECGILNTQMSKCSKRRELLNVLNIDKRQGRKYSI